MLEAREAHFEPEDLDYSYPYIGAIHAPIADYKYSFSGHMSFVVEAATDSVISTLHL